MLILISILTETKNNINNKQNTTTITVVYELELINMIKTGEKMNRRRKQ